MRKVVRRLVAAFFVILMLVTLFPFQVFAVDPVSAATMANALAQALTAYGASHGVSMMFDVSDTSGIGEGLHDLWGQFKTDINDNNVPTYDSLAVTLWTNLYTKVRDNVAINVSAENVGYFDQFWNWLLSGPAEMQRVDDQYYEWNVNNGQIVSPVVYINLGAGLLPFASTDKWNVAMPLTVTDNNTLKSYVAASSWVIYTFGVPSENKVYFASRDSGRAAKVMLNGSDVSTTNLILFDSTYNLYTANYSYTVSSNTTWRIPVYSSGADGLRVVDQKISGTYLSNRISVAPYVGDTVPQNVPIPDTSDPDYSPLPYVGPLGVPWIDNNFGDGETMTDVQREAIAGALDNEIEDDGTLTLEEDQTVPDNPSGEVIGGPSAYTVPGLADVFPFCIPFDIYHFLQALSAEPTAPHFTATLAFPEAVGGSQEIDIDFDTPTFNQIAAILRTMELLAFCVGLALLTRSMFLRG